MAQSEPNPNVDPTITGQEAWFNEDARFYKDVYVYGNLYYDFEGTDAFNLDQLNVSGIATFSDVDITGSLDVTDLTLRNLFSTGISTFTEAVFLNQVDDFQVGIFISLNPSPKLANAPPGFNASPRLLPNSAPGPSANACN